MLVVVSDIHLFDETIGVVVAGKTFSLFASRLRELAYQASMRPDGRYEPVRELDILLLGDILDPLQSTHWLENGLRPWHDPYSPAFIANVREITRAILRKNENAVSVFRRISQGEGIHLPPANRKGQPDLYTLERVHPRVRIFYMVGNHDWFYHLPGPEYDAIRAEIIAALGLSNDPGPFPYGPEDAGPLGEIFGQYRLVARHGDRFDRLSYNPHIGRTGPSLADVYSVEVLYRFPFEMIRQLGDELPPRLSQNIQRMNNIRPILATPLWLFEQVRRHGSGPAQFSRIKQVWDAVVEDFVSLDILQDNRFAGPLARHALRLASGLTRRASFASLAHISGLLRRSVQREHISIARFASQEPALRAGQADIVAYGHTHSHEVVSLDRRVTDARQSDKVYINTGAWATFYDYSKPRPVIPGQKTRPMHLMTCVAIYRQGERRGQRYENWWANFA
jgi:UDP-2,3-diacylglucosamine pyrophosphatase LpxH